MFWRSDPALLARRGDVEGLVRLLSQGRRGRRRGAAYQLRRFPGARVEKALLGAVEDPSWFVSVAAIQSLVALDPDRSPEPIVRAARRREGATDDDTPPSPKELIRLSGLSHVPQLHVAEALAIAVETGAFDDEHFRARRGYLLGAVSRFGRDGGPRSKGALERLTRDDDSIVVKRARQAMGRMEEG